MSNNNNSDKIKSECDFLKHEANVKHDYLLVKNGRSVFNLPKHLIYNTTHNPVLNFFINPKNNYSSTPFGANSNTYIDFELPLINYTYYQFVLRFKILNSSNATSSLMPAPFMIDRVSLLRNSNTFGLDVDGSDVLLYNLNKYYKEVEIGRSFSNLFANIGMLFGGGIMLNNLISVTYNSGGSKEYNIEIPVSLNRSNFCASLIKDNLVLRIYFKNDVCYSGSATEIVLSDVGLVLRMEELNNNQLSHIFKQPKFNHMFNKRVILRYNINKLNAGIEVSVNLAGFRNVCGGMLAYLSFPLNDIKAVNHNGYFYHLYLLPMNDVYITDGTGRNINNNNKLSLGWNNYLIPSKFGSFAEAINQLCYTADNTNENRGMIYYVPFSLDGSDAFNGVYSGGTSFNSTADHVFRFTPLISYDNNILLNIIAFVPALLSLENGILSEILA